jgi:hypothetical protein
MAQGGHSADGGADLGRGSAGIMAGDGNAKSHDRSPFGGYIFVGSFKFGFVGEYVRTPKRNFLKEVPLWTLFKNFKKQ